MWNLPTLACPYVHISRAGMEEKVRKKNPQIPEKVLVESLAVGPKKVVPSVHAGC